MALALCWLTLVPAPANADAPMVTEVTDTLTLTLDDGRMIRLAGIEVPPPRPKAATVWAAALSAVRAAAVHHGASFVPTALVPDRYGRISAKVTTTTGVWLQGMLLTQGLARVGAEVLPAADIRALLAREAGARTQGLGLWALARYRPRDPVDPGPADSFQLIEGRVDALTRVGPRWVLSFSIPPNLEGAAGAPALRLMLTGHMLAACRANGLAPEALSGMPVRVRGWIGRDRDGPLLDLTSPEYLERLPGS